MRRRADGPIGAILAAVSAFCLAVVAYYEVLSYWFTGTDTIPLIETSRVATLGGALDIFAGPLMEGSQFTDRALFYRPVSSLSYAIDYWVWGLDPFGYHLTDLLAHATAAALVCWLAYEIMGDALVAAIAGCVFALHPLSVEVVPTPARRHDVLATVFALVALGLFVRATKATLGTGTTTAEADGKTANGTTADDPSASAGTTAVTTPTSGRRCGLFVAGSVLAYLLALGSKEIALIVPLLVGTWFLASTYGERPPIRRALRSRTALLGPYAVATAAYVALRLVVLGGIGGYDRPAADLSADAIAVTVSRYVLSLVYPVDFLGALSAIEFRLIPNGLYVVLAGASVLAVHNVSRTHRHGSRSVLEHARGRLLAFSAVWFVIPVWLFVRAGRYTLRSGYISIVPVSLVLAVLLVASARDVGRRLRERRSEETGTGAGERYRTDNRYGTNGRYETNGQYGTTSERDRTGDSGPGIATLVVVCVLVASLVAGSALVHSYDEWERAGEVSADTLGAISGATEGTAANATIDVAPVPHPRSARRTGSFPHAQSVTFIWGNTIESWLRLQGRAESRTLYINDTVVLTEVPQETTASARERNGRVTIRVHYDERCPRRAIGADGETTGTHTFAETDARTDGAATACETRPGEQDQGERSEQYRGDAKPTVTGELILAAGDISGVEAATESGSGSGPGTEPVSTSGSGPEPARSPEG
jgi:hypothetical protein